MSVENKSLKISEWVIAIQKLFHPQSAGYFSGKDDLGIPIIIEWEYVDPCSLRLSEKIKSLSDPLVDAYTKIELQFAQKNPDAIKNEMFLKSLEPLLKNGVEQTDWKVAENQIRNNLQVFLTETDWTKFTNNNEIHLFAIIKESETKTPIGLIQFLVNSDYEYGDVKVALYDGVMPAEKNRNVNKLLISTIFKLLSDTKRIFLHTRITNEDAINDHMTFGFTKFSGPLKHWVDLEYRAEHTNILQKIADTLKI